MSNISHNQHPLSRKGTSQSERFPNALRKEYVKLDERTLNDLIAQTAELSKYFNFYESSLKSPDGTWADFFAEVYDFETKKVKIQRLQELEEKSVLSPHLGLFLTFLRLFQLSIENLNTISEKHLLFFYEKMLRLKPKQAISPQVTLIAELAKDIEQLLIPKGTLFKAGKNALGEEKIFSTQQDYLPNQAKIYALKTLNFLDEKIKKREISNSSDGAGGALVDEPKAWSAFGKETDTPAEIGFCISSPFLAMNEGVRVIYFGILNLADFEVFISVEKGWQILSLDQISGGSYSTVLDTNFPKVAAVDEKVHGLKSVGVDPILKFVIKGASSALYLKNKNQSISFDITIEYIGIRNLSVKNELGKIDVSKPFQPFGNSPNNLYSEVIIGHPLLFNKYSTPQIFANEAKVAGVNNTYYLNNGLWQKNRSTSYDQSFDKEYTVQTKNNYIKIKYTGANPSPKVVTVKVTAVADNTQQIQITPPVFTVLTWTDLFINTKVVITPNDKDVFKFYHLHPFDMEEKSAPITLLPAYDRKSYFWIGIEKLKYGQSLSLHFEILEDSGNQQIVHPQIRWFIKQMDQILPLQNNEIVKDTTLKLLQSGNVQFSLSKNRFNFDQAEEDNKLWLLATCDTNYSAIPNFLAVLPQAFVAQNILPESQYVEDISGDTIKKPYLPISGLKKVSQPYRSYGGRTYECTEDFVLRSSERLRHKGVAINIFDFERILLEQFSFLYQVKCITHSTTNSHEAPGDVLVVVVPKLKHDNSQIDLMPRVSVGNRECIKQFLISKASPFVRIDVRNPHYQEVKVEVNIKYMTQYEPDKEFYNEVLNKRLQAFISPWITEAKGVEFNKIGYRSRYINFIEEQEFVDHITFFNLYINNVRIEDKIEAVREDVVFTSVSNHIIRNEDLC